MSKYYPCPCCGQPTIETPDDYDVCPYCAWEDDGLASRHPDEDVGGANDISLAEAREIVKGGKSIYYGTSLPWLPEEFERMMNDQD